MYPNSARALSAYNLLCKYFKIPQKTPLNVRLDFREENPRIVIASNDSNELRDSHATTRFRFFPDISVVRPEMCEATSLGAAISAGMAVGVWNKQGNSSISQTSICSTENLGYSDTGYSENRLQ